MARAKKGDRVQVHYTGTLDNGSIFDSSGGAGYVVYGPMEFVLGQGDLPLRCQEAIVGLEPGHSLKVRVACHEAYGPRDESLVFVTPRAEVNPKEELLDSWRYPNGKKTIPFNPKKGDQMEICLMDGDSLPVLVTEVNDATIILDANHPLAGKDLNFEIKLVSIL
jgi:peptidylprolyl isomerase